MKHFLAAVGLLALVGCGSTPSKIATFTATDLNNAVAIDKLNNDTEKLTCDQWTLSQLGTIDAAVAGAPRVTGIFSLTSELDATTSNVLGALSPEAQVQFETACGPWALHLAGMVTGFKALAAAAPELLMSIGIVP